MGIEPVEGGLRLVDTLRRAVESGELVEVAVEGCAVIEHRGAERDLADAERLELGAGKVEVGRSLARAKQPGRGPFLGRVRHHRLAGGFVAAAGPGESRRPSSRNGKAEIAVSGVLSVRAKSHALWKLRSSMVYPRFQLQKIP